MFLTRLNIGTFNNLSLTPQELSHFRHFCYLKNTLVYTNNLKFLCIQSGICKLSYFHESREFVLCYITKGNIALLDEHVVVEVVENCEVLELSLYKFEELLENKEFSMSLFNQLIRAVLTQREFIKEMVFLGLNERLKRFLVNLSEFASDKFGVFEMKFNMTQLANLLNSTRQSVSTEFNKLLKSGFLVKVSPKFYRLASEK